MPQPRALGIARGYALAPSVLGAIAPTLNALTLSGVSGGTVGQAFSATIGGKTAGSTISANIAGLTVNGTAISGTPTVAGSLALTETLAGATNSPRTTTGIATFVEPVANPVPTISGTPQLESTLSFDYGTTSTVTASRLMKRARGATGNGSDSGKTISDTTYTLQHGRDSELLNQELALEVDVGGQTYRSDWTTPVGYYQSFTAPNGTKAYASPVFLPIAANAPDREFIVVQNNRLQNNSFGNNPVPFLLPITTQQVETLQVDRQDRLQNASHFVRADETVQNGYSVEYADTVFRIYRLTSGNLAQVKQVSYGDGVNYSNGLFATIIDDAGVISCYRNSVLLTTFETNNDRAGNYAGFIVQSSMMLDDVRVIGGAGAGNPGIPTGSSAMTAERMTFASGNPQTETTNFTVDGFGDGTSQPHEMRVSLADAPYTVLKDWHGSYTSFPLTIENVPVASTTALVANGRPVGSTANTSLTSPPLKVISYKRGRIGMAPQGQDYYFVEHPFANLARIGAWRKLNDNEFQYARGEGPVDYATGMLNFIPANVGGGLYMHIARCRTENAPCIIEWDGDENAQFSALLRGDGNRIATLTTLAPRKKRFTYIHSWDNKDSNVELRLTGFDTANPPRNLRVYQEDMGDVLFQPQEIARYQKISTGGYIRSMDIAMVNSAQTSTIDVGDLIPPGYLQVNVPGGGISDRDFIKFCSLAGKNAWINLKFGETEAATRARLALYRDGFTENGTLYKVSKVIIEAPGNEPWNETFSALKRRCASYHLNRPAEDPPGFSQDDVVKGAAKRAIEQFTIVEDVFAGQMERVDRTMSLQLAVSEFMLGIFGTYTHPNGQTLLAHVDSFSPAIYFGDEMQGKRTANNGTSADWEEWTDDFNTLLARLALPATHPKASTYVSGPWILKRLRDTRQAAANLGKRVNTYEGLSLHFSLRSQTLGLSEPEQIQADLSTKPFPGGAYATYLDWFKAFNRAPGWRTFIRDLCVEAVKVGGTHVGFVMMQTPDNYGAFQFMESEKQPEAEQYKFLGVQDAVALVEAV